jgi:hypothetical protein
MRRLLLTLATVLSLLFCTRTLCSAQQSDSDLADGTVHVEFMPYLIVPGMSGDVTVKGHTQSINPSAGDIFGHLQFGFMARTELSYNRFFLGTDTVYMGLGGANKVVNAGVDQWAAELLGGYRVHARLALLGGVRYNSLSANLRFQGPLGMIRGGSEVWWDPFFGVIGNIPLGKRFNVSVRFDEGGFGVGSRVAVNAEPLVNYRINKHLGGTAGWKFLYQDYVDSGNRFEYDVLTQGPLLGLAIRW